MRSSIITWLAFWFLVSVKAQDFPVRDFNPERLVDELLPAQNLDLNYQDLYENILQRLSNPIDLNIATGEELRSLFILREDQVEGFLEYREKRGPLLSVLELQSIKTLDLRTLYALMPFVRVRDPGATFNKSLLTRLRKEGDAYLISRMERTVEGQAGYSSEADSIHHFAGSPNNVYIRFRNSRPGDFSFGFTAEKDAGESITWSPSHRYYGMDYFSFHGQIIHKGPIQNLVLGDCQAQFGQGLVLGGGFGMGKGAETITALRRSNLGFIPYTSLNESGFFRGCAASIGLSKQVTLHALVSGTRRDARVVQDSTVDDSSLISSFGMSGYHRTMPERINRKQIGESNVAAVLNYKARSLEAGMLVHHTDYSLPIVHTPAVYNQLSFHGTSNSNVSCYLNFSKNNIAFFSEAAHTIGQGSAVTAGILGSLSPRVDVSISYRNFSKRFYSVYSNAVAESTAPQNETGMYWGIKYSLARKIVFAAYLDLFRFPWLRYRGYAPSDGSEWLIRFSYQPSKAVVLFMQAREESKIRNLPDESTLYQVTNGVKRNYWIHCEYSANTMLTFKSRMQASTYTLRGKTTRGAVLLQDVNFDLKRFSVCARFALFDTDDYDNRIYIYERDVWLAFSFPAYEGVGVRKILMIQYRISPKIDVWARWVRTQYTDREVIGSQGEAIKGFVQNDLKLQVRMRL